MKNSKSLTLLLLFIFSSFFISCSQKDNDISQKDNAVQFEKTTNSIKESVFSKYSENRKLINSKIKNQGNLSELKQLLNQEKIDSSNIHEVSSLMGFKNFNNFENVLSIHNNLVQQINKDYGFTNLTPSNQYLLLNLNGLPYTTYEDDDDCDSDYKLCVTKAIAMDVMLTSGCLATGPFAIACGISAAIYTAAQVQECRNDHCGND